MFGIFEEKQNMHGTNALSKLLAEINMDPNIRKNRFLLLCLLKNKMACI